MGPAAVRSRGGPRLRRLPTSQDGNDRDAGVPEHAVTFEEASPLAGEIGDVAERLVRHLGDLGVPHYIGGSIASSIHGVMRATADVDVVVFMTPGQGRRLAERLQREFYVSDTAAEDAIRRGGGFNVIHLASSLKVDLFVANVDPLAVSAMPRAARDVRGIAIASAEDVLVAKLRWYRETGHSSDRQWQDVLGIVRVRGEELDRGYCTRLAELVGVADLLERCHGEA